MLPVVTQRQSSDSHVQREPQDIPSPVAVYRGTCLGFTSNFLSSGSVGPNDLGPVFVIIGGVFAKNRCCTMGKGSRLIHHLILIQFLSLLPILSANA